MMTQKDNGGSAFPVSDLSGNWGMSLRDWFAGQALAGMMADIASVNELPGPDAAAKLAYTMADAMLAARAAK